MRMVDWISILVWQNCVFWERGVEHFHLSSSRLLGWELLQGVVSLLSLLVDHVDVSLRKCTSLNVLSTHSNVVSLKVQTEQSHCLTSSPWELILVQTFYSVINVILFYSGMDCKVYWVAHWGFRELPQKLYIETCLMLRAVQWGFKFTPLFGKRPCPLAIRVWEVLHANGFNFLWNLELLFQELKQIILGFFIELLTNHSSQLMKFLRVSPGIWDMLFSDSLVHFRLCELWLINFIMPVLPVTYKVDDYVLFVGFSVLYTEVHHFMHILNVIRVYMDNWDVKCLCDICAVFWASRIDWSCCVAYLVVCDKVYRTVDVKLWDFS